MRTRIVGTLSGLALLGLVLTSAPLAEAQPPTAAPADAAAAAARRAPSQLDWSTCQRADLGGLQCARLQVPLDPGNPKSSTISLALTRLEHTSRAARYAGPVLMNPGGPGGSGLSVPLYTQVLPQKVAGRYDWIGFDPRGVGASRPALTCDGSYNGFDRPPYVPHGPRLIKVWRHRAAGYARDCAQAPAKKLLPHLATRDNVADMEAIRKALGVNEISLYMFSYGTYLEQVYSSLYPNRVDKMVMDATVDPRGVWYGDNLDQDVAFDKAARKFFAYVARHHRAYRLGSTRRDVGRAYYRELHHLRAHPAGKGRVGPDELTDAVTVAGYTVAAWSYVAQGLSDLIHRNRSGIVLSLIEHPGPGADNGYAIYSGTQCTDARWPQHFSRYRRDARRLHREHPFLTWSNTWYNMPCLTWHARHGRPVSVDGARVHEPVLMIGETGDPATPYPGSLEVRRRYPSASLVEGVGGTTHAPSLYGQRCIDGTVTAYLRDGTVPTRRAGNTYDKKCPPLTPRFFSSQGRSAARSSASSMPSDAVPWDQRVTSFHG